MKRSARQFATKEIGVIAFFLAAALPALAADGKVTEVLVRPGQTLNEALKGVEGAALVRLPVGVTEHDAPITREATVVIQGQGREVSILRPSADVALIDQGDLNAPFDGDLTLRDFTYDRAHRHVGEGRAVVASNAGGEVVFRNFRAHRFNFNGKTVPFFLGVGPAPHRAKEDSPRHRYVGFHNAVIDFKADGGIRNRHSSRTGVATIIFNADRFIFDKESVFRGHLTQHADPAQTVGGPPGGRGNAGALGALHFNVWDYGLVDGEFREVDYAVLRYGGVMTWDGVLEIRAQCPDCGFGDQFWPRAYLKGPNGHLIFDGVILTSAEGNPWHDRGLKAMGDWRTITVRNCYISGRDAPIDFSSGSRPGQERQGVVTILNTTVLSRREGVTIGSNDQILEGVRIDNLEVRAHPKSNAGFFRQAVDIRESPDAPGSPIMLSNILAQGYLYDIATVKVSPNSTVMKANLQGTKAVMESRVEGAYPVGKVPRRALTVDGIPAEAAEIRPIATVKDFNNAENFSRLDVYLTHDTRGVYLMVALGTDTLSHHRWDADRMYRGDAISFAITQGMPGDYPGFVRFDLAKHDERGVMVWRHNAWPEQDLSSGLIDLAKSDIKVAVALDKEAKTVTYEAFFPWQEIGLPAPWYTYLSVDLTAAKGDTYPKIKGSYWPSPYPNLGEGTEAERARSGGIFHPPAVPTRGFKAVECE